MPRAARMSDSVVCPDAGHASSRIDQGESTVLIGGRPAARHDDAVRCPWREHESVVVAGEYEVLIGGSRAARIADETGSGGMISEGCPDVLIDESGFDAVAAAIARIRLSPYAETEEGKRVLAKLEYLRAIKTSNRVRVEPPQDDRAEGASTAHEVVAYVDKGDVNKVAAILVHETTHSLDPRELPKDATEKDAENLQVARERAAWDAELAYYREQRARGSYTEDPALEEYGRLPDSQRDAFLRRWYNEKR
jgi:uncharacterized Zn-binding protein involved in type VI secretion